MSVIAGAPMPYATCHTAYTQCWTGPEMGILAGRVLHGANVQIICIEMSSTMDKQFSCNLNSKWNSTLHLTLAPFATWMT